MKVITARTAGAEVEWPPRANCSMGSSRPPRRYRVVVQQARSSGNGTFALPERRTASRRYRADRLHGNAGYRVDRFTVGRQPAGIVALSVIERAPASKHPSASGIASISTYGAAVEDCVVSGSRAAVVRRIRRPRRDDTTAVREAWVRSLANLCPWNQPVDLSGDQAFPTLRRYLDGEPPARLTRPWVAEVLQASTRRWCRGGTTLASKALRQCTPAMEQGRGASRALR